MKKCKRYLENVVFHVTDLNLFLQVPIWAEGSQQRLESEKKTCSCVCVSDAASVSLRSSVQRDPPVRSCDQQDPVAIERFPIHHERHVGHLLVIQEVRVC